MGSLKPADPSDTPLLQHLKNKAKERRTRAEKRRGKWSSQMDSIGEDEQPSSKKGKWRCSECGTSKNLEEDPDDRGSFYCTGCWESWEEHPVPKKKKKKKKYREEEEYEEEEEDTSKKKKKKRDRDMDAA